MGVPYWALRISDCYIMLESWGGVDAVEDDAYGYDGRRSRHPHRRGLKQSIGLHQAGQSTQREYENTMPVLAHGGVDGRLNV